MSANLVEVGRLQEDTLAWVRVRWVRVRVGVMVLG